MTELEAQLRMSLVALKFQRRGPAANADNVPNCRQRAGGAMTEQVNSDNNGDNMEATEAVKIEADLAKAQALVEREHAVALTVTTPEEYRVAAEALKQTCAKHRQIDEQRKKATKPLDEAKRQIMDWFRPALDNLDSAIMSIRRGLTSYEAEQKKREDAAAAAYATASGAEREAAKVQLVATFNNTVEKIEGVTKRTIWKFEITDPTAIPREYLAIDEKKIGAVVRALKADASIPGVRVYAETSLAISGGDNE